MMRNLGWRRVERMRVLRSESGQIEEEFQSHSYKEINLAINHVSLEEDT